MLKDEVIKNPLRNIDNNQYTPYIPQYKKLNIEPEDYVTKKTESSGSFIDVKDNKDEENQDDTTFDYVPQNYIDNNDYVSDEVAVMMGHDINSFKKETKTVSLKKDEQISVIEDTKNENNKLILIVKDMPVASSNSEEEIKHNIELLLLGEHNKFLNQKISLQEIYLYKKINISYGVYFKE